MRYIDFAAERDQRIKQSRYTDETIRSYFGHDDTPARVAVSPDWKSPASDEDSYLIEEFDREAGEYRPAGFVTWEIGSGWHAADDGWRTVNLSGVRTKGVCVGWIAAVKDYRYLRSYATQDEALTLHHALYH